ncbi:N-acetylmuramic acid 6-phosphate etherase [Priestia abyssalis]|uniref:N-acetylmuramic acid 6-phosphate etherase n=1 Tax=Priestia abyssalis TaxID=1221450 RepID=UPI000995A169|nr:N-acetylmuramic acid 6-phosphate etherase [Priestia abyssalis]
MMAKKTEERNMRSLNLDEMSAQEIVSLMQEEDREIHFGISPATPHIAKAVEEIVKRWQEGGRVFVIGAGTSGRIGMLDAVELGPTFSVESDRWTAIVAGGNEAMWQPLEENEDDEAVIQAELKSRNLNEKDTIIGIAASGSTPFVVSGLLYGKKQGALTIAISNNEQTKVSAISDIGIEAVAGPEVIRGSTRLKAGTTQKMIINMISTAVMVRLGKVYGNEMVDMKLINQKLVQRAAGIIQTVADIPEEEAFTLLKKSQFQLKEALFMALTDASQEEAVRFLQETDGHIKKAVTLFFGKNTK